MPKPAATAAAKAAMPFSLIRPPCSPRWAKGRSVRKGRASGRADKDDRVDLYRRAQRQHRNPHGAAGMLARLAKDIDHQFGRAIGDLGLVRSEERRVGNTCVSTCR